MKYRLIIGLFFSSIYFDVHAIFGEYYNEKNSFTQLVINKDSTFSYFDVHTMRTIESGFINVNNDTLILISNGICFDCFDVIFEEHTDTTKFFFSFDQELKKKFSDLKVYFGFRFEKQYDIDDENNLIIQDLALYQGLVVPFVISFRSRNFNSDIDLLSQFRRKNNFYEKTIYNNLISVKFKPDYEKNVRKQEIFVKYLITQSGDLMNIGSLGGVIKMKIK